MTRREHASAVERLNAGQPGKAWETQLVRGEGAQGRSGTGRRCD